MEVRDALRIGRGLRDPRVGGEFQHVPAAVGREGPPQFDEFGELWIVGTAGKLRLAAR